MLVIGAAIRASSPPFKRFAEGISALHLRGPAPECDKTSRKVAAMLYAPPHFLPADHAVAHEAVRRQPFASLVSETADGPFASHLPMLIDAEGGPNGRLVGHIARANPHWKCARPDRPALAIFSGPGAYVSPGWYPSKTRDGKAVPTWNYTVVQARGPLRWIDDPVALRDIVERLTDRFEAGRKERWRLSDAPDSYIAAMLRGIIGVEMTIEDLVFKQKLSQNRTVEDQAGVIAGLGSETDEAAQAVASLMSTAPLRA